MPIPITWNFDHHDLVSVMLDDGTIMFPEDAEVRREHLPNGLGYEIIDSEEIGDVTVLRKIRVREIALCR